MSYKFKWKRKKVYRDVWHPVENDYRGYDFYVDGEDVGHLCNDFYNHISDDTRWYIIFLAKGSNIKLKHRWEFNDIETAKSDAIVLFNMIMDSKPESSIYTLRQRILEFGRVKEKI